MTELLYILEEISLPIVLLIAIGFVFQKIFKTNVRTYSKLMMYLLIPVVIFTKMYQIDIAWDFFFLVVPFIAILEVMMFFLAFGISAAFRYKKSLRNAFSNSLVLFNTGNYGIPLIELVFRGNPVATASQLFIVVIQNITSNTFGVFQASSGQSSRSNAFLSMLKMPSLYVLLLVAVFKLTGARIPNTVVIPLDYISNMFVGFALITLGVQLANVRLGSQLKEVLTASIVKVIAGPALGFALLLLLGIKGLLAQALIIGISTPSAVNSSILASEFGNEPEFAAQTVFATTVFCTFTLPLVIYAARIYF
ncbi:MAG: AEC family transporter [Christensenellales bacterium]